MPHRAMLSRLRLTFAGAVVAAALGLMAGFAQAAGLQSVAVPADADGPALKALVWSPCATAPADLDFGDIVAPRCAIARSLAAFCR